MKAKYGDGRMLTKRLEEGTFELPQLAEGRQDLEVKWERLVMILEGIQLNSVKQRKRYVMADSLS